MAELKDPNGHVHGPNCSHGHAVKAPVRNEGPKIGRNDPCVCGSGKKSKVCCGKAA
jgi:preprotein translocase subunit SecA